MVTAATAAAAIEIYLAELHDLEPHTQISLRKIMRFACGPSRPPSNTPILVSILTTNTLATTTTYTTRPHFVSTQNAPPF